MVDFETEHSYLDTCLYRHEIASSEERLSSISWTEERERCRICFTAKLVKIDGREYSLVRWKYIP